MGLFPNSAPARWIVSLTAGSRCCLQTRSSKIRLSKAPSRRWETIGDFSSTGRVGTSTVQPTPCGGSMSNRQLGIALQTTHLACSTDWRSLR